MAASSSRPARDRGEDAAAQPRPKPRPSWALAWISQDWRRKRPVTAAYKLASAGDVAL